IRGRGPPVRFLWVVLVFPLVAAPQTGSLVSGVLLERDAQTASGQFSVRATDNQVFRYLFDPQTYVERDDVTIDVARLQPGDKVEVVSDRMPHADLRYALTIHVLPSTPPRTPGAARPRPPPRPPPATAPSLGRKTARSPLEPCSSQEWFPGSPAHAWFCTCATASTRQIGRVSCRERV